MTRGWMARLLVVMIALVALGASAQEGAETVTLPDGMVEVKETHFRIGINGFAAFDHFGDDAVAAKVGAAVVLPHFDVIIKYGLGMRFGFDVTYHKAGEGSVQSTGEVSGIDVTYYEETDVPETVTTERVDGWIFSYGPTINFKYELTVPAHTPAYRVFRHIQPYFGVGVGLTWNRTHTDIPKEMSVLIENENYRGADAQDWDPWSIQFAPAFNLFGGTHFNLGKTFRLNIEVGYYMVEVPGDETDGHLKYSTDGNNAHHEPYKINDFKLGGGFEFRF